MPPEAEHPTKTTKKLLREALAAARKAERSFLVYLIEMALVEAEESTAGPGHLESPLT